MELIFEDLQEAIEQLEEAYIDDDIDHIQLLIRYMSRLLKQVEDII